MKRVILLLLATIGGVFLFLIVSFAALSWALLSPSALPDRIVLELDLEEGLVETMPADPLLLALERSRLRTRDVVEALERAADDPRVAALLVRGSGGLSGWATAEELREAVARFRESGKPAIYFTETFGEFTPGQLAYHLATAFEEVYIQPSGEVGLAPLLMEGFFLRGALDRLEVEPRFDRRWEYKDAPEMFTETEFTPPAREARVALIETLERELLEGMSRGRGLAPDSARALLQGGPYPAREALAGGLVDDLVYLDEVRDRLGARLDLDLEPVGMARYLERAGRQWNRGPRVALIYGVGAIHRGRSGFDFLTGGSSMGSATVARAIREATEDDRVRAILFRVDSPGGSWVASDQIRREIRRAGEQGIPVVVSMGDLAASGGYVVAMDAARIVAHPATFTGSIGVLAGKLVTEDFFESIGIDWDQVQATEGAGFYSAVEDFSPEHWARFQLFLDRIYEDFVEGVAAARGMTVSQVDPIARGRIWSGADAFELGLVDHLGGFSVALDAVRELLEEQPDAPLDVAVYPAERTLFQLLLEEGWGPTRSAGGGTLSAFAAPLQAVLRAAVRVGIFEAPGPVRMSPWDVPGR